MALTDKKMLDLEGLRHYNEKVTGELNKKQDTLVSGTNIKTVNGQDITGSGDIELTSITDTEIGDLFETGILEAKYVSQESIQEAINTEY